MKTKRYKIQVLGGNVAASKQPQAYIAIPMKWLRSHGLERGDVLEVSYDVDEESFVIGIVGATLLK